MPPNKKIWEQIGLDVYFNTLAKLPSGQGRAPIG